MTIPSRDSLNMTPDPMSILRGLLGEDMQNRDMGYSPGMPQSEMAKLMGDDPSGSLSTIPNDRLMEQMGAFSGGVSKDGWNALRKVIEGRSSDDVARGQGPQGVKIEEPGKTTAEKDKEDEGMGVFKLLNRAFRGSNELYNQQQEPEPRYQ